MPNALAAYAVFLAYRATWLWEHRFGTAPYMAYRKKSRPSKSVAYCAKRMDSPQRISHESIYSAIYAMPRAEFRSEVIALLRMPHKTHKPRTRGDDRSGLISNMPSIDERPLEVSRRLEALPDRHTGRAHHLACGISRC